MAVLNDRWLLMRIGLTGGIAAGKSTVAAHFADLGAVVIDYDALARRAVAPGSQGLQKIVQVFGSAALAPDGSLDRAWMARHVFGEGNEGARKKLDAIEHPLIYRLAGIQEAQALAERASVSAGHAQAVTRGGAARLADSHRMLSDLIVHDVPLLAEVIDEIPFDFDHIVTVEAPKEIRIARMMNARGMSREQAESRIAHQSSKTQREAIADVVIDATQKLEQMFEHVDMLVAQWGYGSGTAGVS
jgi:dephospho-CoA kinase